MICKPKFYLLLTLILGLAFLQSCGPRLSSQATELLSGSVEVPPCLESVTFADAQVVTGVAKFYKRTTDLVITDNQIQNIVLGDPISDPLPIAYAEIAIYDESKKVIQCGVTDASGSLTNVNGGPLTVPKKIQNYIIRVYARTHQILPHGKFSANAAVKEDIYSQKVHYVETTFSSDSINITPINLIARARQTEDIEIRGGAFNILNDFVQAYLYLDQNLSSLPSDQLACLSSGLNIYWKAGFNPEQYIFPTSDPKYLVNSSFYRKETKSFYVSGGQLGDVSLANTDHFDDFVLIHEMGHFLEDHCAKLTKGGSHALIVRIDPRLAWHEAWANYFASVVMHDNLASINPYLKTKLEDPTKNTDDIGFSFLYDTYGFSDSVQNIGNGSGFLMDLKKPNLSPGVWQNGPYNGVQFDPTNPLLYPGEGHFREGAITRTMFKMTIPQNTLCASCSPNSVFASVPINFSSMWQAFDAYTGQGVSAEPFVSSNLFLEKLKNVITSPVWSSTYKSVSDAEALQLFSDNNLAAVSGTYVTSVNGFNHLNWLPFGHRLTTTATCLKPTVMQPRSDDPAFTGQNSDQRYSNHFYNLDVSQLSGLETLNVLFTRVAGSNTDFDILIFQDGYLFNEDYICSVVESTDGYCSSNTYNPTRTISSDVIVANRSTAANLTTPFTKSISNLSKLLDPTKKYILNIRAYTANRSLSVATLYQYKITSNLGELCPE